MQVLTVCRFEAGWAFRDVTGEIYGRSPDIRRTFEAAQQMARRIGAHIKFSAEAESHYRDATEDRIIDLSERPAANASIGAFAFLWRFMRRKREGNENI